MKTYSTLFVFAALIAVGCSQSHKPDLDIQSKDEDSFWTAEKEMRHLENRNDSATWDVEMLQNDLDASPFLSADLPFKFGVFPNPNYDLIGKGSFKGLGVYGMTGGDDNELKIGDKTILYNSFYAGASDVTSPFVGEKNNSVFFQIIVLTDFVDTLDYSHLQSQVVSRNHPDYIGQGFYKTKNNRIDYTAFMAADQTSYAIVNLRIFNLKHGRTLLIAPQKDQSMRSLQLELPHLSSDEIDSFTIELLKRPEVIDFFTYSGNI